MMSEDDHLKRVQYAQFLLNKIDILDSIMWTDEAYFSVNGYVHRKNCVIWGAERPKLTVQSALHSPQVCVWIGFTANAMLPPFFFTGTVTGDNYRDMLENHVFPELRRRHLINQVIFQQDGAPPHFSKAARDFLGSQLPDTRIISRGFPQTWPARSPDLSPLDYYLWGTMKSRVFHNFVPSNLNQLKERIKEIARDIGQEELRRAVHHLPHRLECVIDQDGGPFEHLL